MLEEYLRPTIWGTETEAEPATERQRAFLKALGSTRSAQPSLTKPVASAWIDHHLSLRNTQRLRDLLLARGDAVLKRTVWPHTQTVRPHESLEYSIVSSIGANGLVYFKGGNGKCGWPSTLTRAAPTDTPGGYPQFRELL
jgi:hypothetical protein